MDGEKRLSGVEKGSFETEKVIGVDEETTAGSPIAVADEKDDSKKKFRYEYKTPLGINRFFLLFLYILIVFIKGCTYWGWNGLQDMFYKSGAFSWTCEGSTDEVFTIDDKIYPDCPNRRNAINNLYTTCFATHFVTSALAGAILDFAGPKISMVVGLLIEFAGWMMIGFSTESVQAFYPGVVFLGTSVDTTYLPLLSVAKLIPGHEGLIISILGTVRSLSFAIPVIMSAIYQSDSFLPDSFWKFIVAYACLTIVLGMLTALFCIPMKPLDSPKKIYIGENGEEIEEEAKGKNLSNDVDEDVSFRSAITTPQYILIIFAFAIALLRSEFYTKSNKDQLKVSSGKDLYQMFSVFNILSFLPGPVMGKLVDLFGCVFVIAVLNFSGLMMYIFVMPDILALKGISIFFNFLYTSFVISHIYCYVAFNCPKKYFGKMTGLISAIGGVFSLANLGWYHLSSATLINWKPYNFLLADGFMVAIGIINYIILFVIWTLDKKKAKSKQSQLLQKEMEPVIQP